MNKTGLTTIEIIMVIVIIAIVAVVIATRTGYYYPVKLDGAGQKLLSDIRYAKRLAMTNHKICGILFDVSGNSYTVYDYEEDPPAAVDDPHSPGNPLTLDYDDNKYYNGIEIDSVDFGATNELKFNSFGVPYDGNDIELATDGQVIISTGGANFTITVTPRTGKVSHD